MDADPLLHVEALRMFLRPFASLFVVRAPLAPHPRYGNLLFPPASAVAARGSVHSSAPLLKYTSCMGKLTQAALR
jgi:hypothetical protein